MIYRTVRRAGTIIRGNRKSVLIPLLAAALLIASATGARANGTASGTVISNNAGISASNASSVTSNTAATTVVAIFGVATNSEPADNSATAGGFVYYKTKFTNNANNTDIIRLNVGAQSFGAGAGTTTNWSIQADDADPYALGLTWTTSGTMIADQLGDYATMSLGPGAVATFTIMITSAADASDGATMSAVISLQTVSTPAGKYVGFDSIGYGGLALATRTAGALTPDKLTTTITGAILTLAKAASVTAPAGYVTLGGAGTAPVPGAKITYTLTYGNTGASNALTTVIQDTLPALTTYLPGSIFLNAILQTDALGGDECDFNVALANAVTCNIGTLNAAGSGTITYVVTID